MGMKYRHAIPLKYDVNYYNGKEMWPPVYPTQDQLEEYKKWCKANVGPNGWNYYGMYRKIPCEFRFKRGEDLVAFKLRFVL